MKFRSTVGRTAGVSFADALLSGMPADGGLFMPERLPKLNLGRLRGLDYPALAFELARPFVGDDIGDAALRRIVRDAYDFAVPIRWVGGSVYVLELFHGPTLSFKDFGARFMARAMQFLLARRRRRATVVVATSGDTGSAVAHGFCGMRNVRVLVLFPRGRVSPFQRRQLGCLGGNIVPLEVDGDFDACHALARRALADPALADRNLSSANSINVGRLVPQIFYYVWAFLRVGGPVSVCVPSGNFGNVTAALMARQMGVPFDRVLAATNVNDSVPRYLATGRFEPRPTRATISNAMDVGRPSNFARILDLFGRRTRRALGAIRVTEAQTRATMRRVRRTHGLLLDPHTAVGWRAIEGAGGGRWILAGTASPAKFPELMRRIAGARVRPPRLPSHDHARPLADDYEALKTLILG
jgi:threonine synthase